MADLSLVGAFLGGTAGLTAADLLGTSPGLFGAVFIGGVAGLIGGLAWVISPLPNHYPPR